MSGLPLLAGIARRVVTPSPLIPVTRGTGAVRPAREKLGELEVRVLALAQGDTRLAIVSLPFIGWPGPLGARVRGLVRSVPPENILLAATHNHTAPDTYGFPDSRGGFAIDMEYLGRVCAQTAEAIEEAVHVLQPVTLKTACGEAFGKIAYNLYAPELYDPRCGVIQVSRPDGSIFATLVNYACHPEVLLHQEVCSPDFVGPLYDYVDTETCGMTLFVNGAQGGMVTADTRTPDGERGDWAECVRIGETLGREALRLIAGAEPQADPALWCGARPLTIPVSEAMASLMGSLYQGVRELLALPDRPTEVTAQQNVVNLGDTQILTIPGEALPNIGYYLKRNMRGRHNLLFGLTNDGLGYFLSRVDYDSFKAYNYITATSMHERAGEVLIDESLEFVGACPRPVDGAGR